MGIADPRRGRPEAREQAERDTAAALAAVEHRMPILLRSAFVGSAPAVVLLFALEAGRRRPFYDHAVVDLYFLGLVAGFQLLDQPVALTARNLLRWLAGKQWRRNCRCAVA